MPGFSSSSRTSWPAYGILLKFANSLFHCPQPKYINTLQTAAVYTARTNPCRVEQNMHTSLLKICQMFGHLSHSIFNSIILFSKRQSWSVLQKNYEYIEAFEPPRQNKIWWTCLVNEGSWKMLWQECFAASVMYFSSPWINLCLKLSKSSNTCLGRRTNHSLHL